MSQWYTLKGEDDKDVLINFDLATSIREAEGSTPDKPMVLIEFQPGHVIKAQMELSPLLETIARNYVSATLIPSSLWIDRVVLGRMDGYVSHLDMPPKR
ncbi:hypothetical protein [Microvirga sp. BSC39]|uniref:hypothetical protein n=1 Tax=Microvirga sp. BSC39 TaxID=1549810 RepID=UPI0004E94011|nr:hypothetical protein [Microvirga sp. BSC39]KFG71036.1 hypothetical protein JH26_00370 [Microvirga sp. BSC39]